MNQIGTISEKSVHSLIKEYLEPNKEMHEIKIGRYIADIKNDKCIYEIQTQQFKKLLNKIDYYISINQKVTIVYPLIKKKYINWIDPISNKILERRKTPHNGVIQDMFKELYWIVDYLENELVELSIILINAEEYKYLDGIGHNSKKRATKIDKIPTSIEELIKIKSINDLIVFVPDTLPKEFSSRDFIKHSKCNKRWAGSGIKILREKNIIRIVNKKGNSYIYSVNQEVKNNVRE